MGKVVCVTGASGFIASWLVKLLLQRGYTVKGTVRNLGDPTKVAHLKALEGAEERLQLYEADLLEEGSFDSVVDGCDGVFHTASPVSLSVSDPQTELLDPAIKGTVNVLKSCKKASTIKRVLVTSSMAAVLFNYNPLKHDVVIDETWFSDPIFCEEKRNGMLSQNFSREGYVGILGRKWPRLGCIAPRLCDRSSTAANSQFDLLALVNIIKEGKQLWPNGVYRFVDVRDVCLAHILAFENPTASGRYCLVGRVTYSFEALDILNRIFPSLNLHPYNTENQPTGPPYQVSQDKAKTLGLNFTPLEVSLRDTVESLKEKNFINF